MQCVVDTHIKVALFLLSREIEAKERACVRAFSADFIFSQDFFFTLLCVVYHLIFPGVFLFLCSFCCSAYHLVSLFFFRFISSPGILVAPSVHLLYQLVLPLHPRRMSINCSTSVICARCLHLRISGGERERHVRLGLREGGQGRVPDGHGGQRAGAHGLLRLGILRDHLEGGVDFSV